MKKIFTIDFTKSFIDELSAYIEREFTAQGRSFDKTAIVFGGKRPALFLKRKLAQTLGQSFVSPRFFTIDEFMDYVANRGESLQAGLELDRSFTLYGLAKRLTPQLLKGRESFAQFLPWAREILDFIEQLDLEAVDNSALLAIQQNAAIGYAVPESINDLLKNIKLLREAFHHDLKKRGLTFRGLQYLRAAQEVKKHSWEEFDDVLFCNLFYFHQTEEDVVRCFYEKDKARLIFQGDERKWPVLKRIASRMGCELLEGGQPTPTAFKLHLHAGFDAHSEAAIVRGILSKTKDFDKTVIVLPNTENVVPLLSELPADFSNLNVSMGYRLKRSSLYFLFGFIMKAQLSHQGERYYSRDYLRVLTHPFIKNLAVLGNGVLMQVLVHKIEEALTGRVRANISGSSFITLDEVLSDDEIFELAAKALPAGVHSSARELKESLLKVHEIFFAGWQKVSDLSAFAGCLGTALDILVDKSFLKKFPLNINIASRMYDVIREFEDAAFHKELFSFDDIVRIF
ncbi:MAG: hypothetical protein HQL16_06060, partial [Candidatus Omnitrophica bacterium]|nr:hypothetical protein [Candidatus Omnitrophota bacterium]